MSFYSLNISDTEKDTENMAMNTSIFHEVCFLMGRDIQ